MRTVLATLTDGGFQIKRGPVSVRKRGALLPLNIAPIQRRILAEVAVGGLTGKWRIFGRLLPERTDPSPVTHCPNGAPEADTCSCCLSTVVFGSADALEQISQISALKRPSGFSCLSANGEGLCPPPRHNQCGNLDSSQIPMMSAWAFCIAADFGHPRSNLPGKLDRRCAHVACIAVVA